MRLHYKLKLLVIFTAMWGAFLFLFLAFWACLAQHWVFLQIHVPTYFFVCLFFSFILAYLTLVVPNE